MTSLRLVERAMYLPSVVDEAVIVCILDAQVMGAPAKRMTQPERIWTSWGRYGHQNDANFQCRSASTNNQSAMVTGDG